MQRKRGWEDILAKLDWDETADWEVVSGFDAHGCVTDGVRSALLAILTDPQVGFKEALERGRSLSKAGDSLFHEIDELMGDTDPIEDDDATLACQEWWKALHEFESIAAEAKLAELKELEAKK